MYNIDRYKSKRRQKSLKTTSSSTTLNEQHFGFFETSRFFTDARNYNLTGLTSYISNILYTTYQSAMNMCKPKENVRLSSQLTELARPILNEPYIVRTPGGVYGRPINSKIISTPNSTTRYVKSLPSHTHKSINPFTATSSDLAFHELINTTFSSPSLSSSAPNIYVNHTIPEPTEVLFKASYYPVAAKSLPSHTPKSVNPFTATSSDLAFHELINTPFVSSYLNSSVPHVYPNYTLTEPIQVLFKGVRSYSVAAKSLPSHTPKSVNPPTATSLDSVFREFTNTTFASAYLNSSVPHVYPNYTLTEPVQVLFKGVRSYSVAAKSLPSHTPKSVNPPTATSLDSVFSEFTNTTFASAYLNSSVPQSFLDYKIPEPIKVLAKVLSKEVRSYPVATKSKKINNKKKESE